MNSPRLLEHITTARWFGGKGRSAELVSVTPLPWLRSPGDWPACRCEVATLRYADGTTEQYQLMISYRPATDDTEPLIIIDDPDHGRLGGIDASSDADFHAALLQLITTTDGVLPADRQGHPAIIVRGRALPHGLAARMPTRVFAGEQSNTSILYGTTAWLKLFRRLEGGPNPDIAVHDQLSRAGNDKIARLYGWLQADELAPDDRPTDLAMLVEQVSQATDGWALALTAVRQGESFDDQAAALGSALAAVHADLRQHFPTGTTAGDQVADLMIERLRAATAVVPELAPYAPALTVVFDRLRGGTIAVQRLHADFHLGQTLKSPSGWKIIDFEGEPAKSFDERTRPDHIWRDLAGALRSFDYAAAHAPDTGRVANWRSSCRRAFLAGYGQTATRQTELATAYLADKAIYEIVYESRNRPDWVRIPFAAVTELAAGTQ